MRLVAVPAFLNLHDIWRSGTDTSALLFHPADLSSRIRNRSSDVVTTASSYPENPAFRHSIQGGIQTSRQ